MEKQKTAKKAKQPKFKPPPGIINDKKSGKQYVRGRLLGEGGFAVCYEVFDDDHQRFAVKVICKASLKNEKQKQKLLAEIRIHQAMRHRHIVEFVHVFEDDAYVYLILELCENRTMVDLLRKKKRLSEDDTRFFMRQILDGVEYLHNHHIIHRDLKLGNFFLTKDMQVKIGDFGLAAYIKHDGERKKTICGTPNYIAPEVLFDSENGHSYEVDVWSLGVVMYTLLVGRPPFQTQEVKAIYKRIRDCEYEFPVSLNLSEESTDLVSALLTSKPENRPGLFDIRYHPFFSNSQKGTDELEAPLEESPVIHKPPAPKSPGPAENCVPHKAAKPYPNGAARPSAAHFSTHPAPLRTRTTPMKFLDAPKPNVGSFAQPAKPATPQSTSTETLSVVGSPADSLPSPSSPLRAKLRDPLYSTPELKTEHLPVFEAVLCRVRDAFDLHKAHKSGAAERQKSERTLSSTAAFYARESAVANLQQKEPLVFVSRWIDYSNKWGLGYQLSNGNIGVYFNDQTNLVMACDQQHFEYLDWVPQSDRLALNRIAFNAHNYPSELHKKVGLMRYFKQFMSDNLYKATTSAAALDEASAAAYTDMDYVNKYLRTKHAVLFRLSNRVLQLNFYDHTKFILRADGCMVTILGPGRNSEQTIDLYSLLLEGDPGFVEKVHYVKNLMATLINLKRKKKQEHAGASKPHVDPKALVPTNQFVKLTLC